MLSLHPCWIQSKKVNALTFNNSAKVMTIHKAKGLGEKHIFIIGCSDGLLPHHLSMDDSEERKILYVGITRAKETLHLTRPKKYLGKKLDESPYIEDLEDAIKKIK